MADLSAVDPGEPDVIARLTARVDALERELRARGRAPFTSPYRMFPDVDAARDELAREAAEHGNVIDPQAAVWDPTKPTIQQTRANAISSIQQNFEALIPTKAIDPSGYLKKTNDTAQDLRIKSSVSTSVFHMDGLSGQTKNLTFETNGTIDFDMLTALGDATGAAWFKFRAWAQTGSVPSIKEIMHVNRTDGNVAFAQNVSVGAQRAPGDQSPFNLDINGPVPRQFIIHETSSANGVMWRTHVASTGVYWDILGAYADGRIAPIGSQPLNIRSADNVTGALQSRLTVNSDGAIRCEIGGFTGRYTFVANAGDWVHCDLRTGGTTQGMAAGCVVSGISLHDGQVARLYVASYGAGIYYPANWYVTPGGPQWGYLTVITLLQLGATTFATFVPYNNQKAASGILDQNGNPWMRADEMLEKIRSGEIVVRNTATGDPFVPDA